MINNLQFYSYHYDLDKVSGDMQAQKGGKLPIMMPAKCTQDVKDIDKTLINSMDTLSVQILSMVAAQQKQVVLTILGANPELIIAGMLAASIEIYALQLEKIYGWTQGGVEMFRSSLMVMLEGIKKDGVNSAELEDLFQLALLEVMVNAEEYGLEDWYEKNKVHISHVLESTGSGSHSLHESDYNTPEKMAQWVTMLYDSMKKEGNIPPDSLLGQILAEIDKKGGSKALSDQIINHWDDSNGWWVSTPDNKGSIERVSNNISPMLRLFLLSSLLEEQPMSKEQVELILTGSLDEIDEFVEQEFGVTNSKYGSASLTWLEENTTWRITNKDGLNQIDWEGVGIDINDLHELYQEFPGRELSEDELEEINRIGDQVKMLQQTLKYWTQLCFDEQLAMARNI
ncbi:hypothetical protein [Providencia burhodogranariea]|uniref:Uncharacterized protein n=1 Tax=Providencia burhodogranariea DSM 19968 TaxID=1141662 RepID=K8X850_9GAMM|nr:hypothetical protein [Providencia burhodogranariea]EKT64605.1 hypothetical protein OOA_02372 [Providencia burhodogranariea DSM 19968]